MPCIERLLGEYFGTCLCFVLSVYIRGPLCRIQLIAAKLQAVRCLWRISSTFIHNSMLFCKLNKYEPLFFKIWILNPASPANWFLSVFLVVLWFYLPSFFLALPSRALLGFVHSVAATWQLHGSGPSPYVDIGDSFLRKHNESYLQVIIH